MTIRSRLWVKNAICALGFGDRLIEYCQICGLEMPLIWWVDNAFWRQITGYETPKGDNAPGLYCPVCFDAASRRQGFLLRWRAEIDPDSLPVVRACEPP